MKQYLEVLNNIVKDGVWVENRRTKSKCKVALNQVIKMEASKFPLVTTRQSYWKTAVKELLCYMRGYTDLRQFHFLNVHTWDKNCESWKSPYKKSDTDLGTIYGASAEKVGMSYADLVQNIKEDPSSRSLIWSFWNPSYFEFGCLKPCMHSHQFTVLGDTIYLTSTQRSQDVPLGGNFNMIQAWFLLFITAKLTGYKMGTVTLNIVNAHIYENQLEMVKEQLRREPKGSPWFTLIKDDITLYDLLEGITNDNFDDFFKVDFYNHYPPINYPLTA